MKIDKLFNTTKEEIKLKRFNIFIGISIGNKWFTKKNLKQYLDWALINTKDKVLFLIADEIHAINYSVRSKTDSEKRNLKRALKEGDKIEKIIKQLISELPKKEQVKINILRWGEYKLKDGFYNNYNKLIYNEFIKNPKFKKDILKLVRNSIKDRGFSEEEYLRLSKYFLEEFLTIYSGILLDSTYFEFYPYPSDTLISIFIEKIQKKEIFPELNKKLPKKNVAWAVMR